MRTSSTDKLKQMFGKKSTKYNQPGETPAQTESKMELQQGLNNVIRERIAKRIQTGSMNVF